jgi:plastocyanin
MYTSTILIGVIAFTGVFAAPATTTLERRIVSRTTPSVVTHTVAVGRGGLKFEPDNVVAEIGEIIEFHYLPKNHSVAQSSFDKPCVPLDNGASIFSGFQPTADGQSKNVFQVEIKTKAPLWFYCSQPVGQHCKNGMNMAVNQVFDSKKTLREYRAAAALTGDPISPAVIGGGLVIPNPNPLAGL